MITEFQKMSNYVIVVKMTEKKETLIGLISINTKGVGFFDPDPNDKNRQDSIEIQLENINRALHGDIVEISLMGETVRNRVQGKVEKVIKRAKEEFVGTVSRTVLDTKERLIVVPDDKRLYVDIPLLAGEKAEEGNKVKKGELLIQMACEDIKLNNELAQKDFVRAERLLKMGSLSQENFDHLKSKKDDAALKTDWCSIKALKDSSVLNTYREEGEYVTPGSKLLTLVNLSEVWTIIYVPQDLLAKISTGMKLTGYLPELKMRPFEGKITYISDAAEFTPKNVQTREERTRLVFGVKITFTNPDELLKPGMSIEVKLE